MSLRVQRKHSGRTWAGAVGCVLRESSGNALVELALVFSFLGVPLLLGTIQSGWLLYDHLEITNAAHVGALYGMRSSTFASDANGITAAARAEAPELGTSLAIASTVFYACSGALDGTQYASQSAADTACTSGLTRDLQFVQVDASVSVTPMAHIPGLPTTYTLRSRSVMEVQE